MPESQPREGIDNGELDGKIQAFRDILSTAKRIVVLAGAGLSAGSGVPTFRGKEGVWRKHDALSLSTPAAFIGNPSRIWQFHHFLREKMFKATPNPAHIALARFTIPELRHRLSPESSFTLITQKIDGLDRRAIEHVHAEAGRPSPFSTTTADTRHRNDPLLIEMHGHIGGVLCTSYQCRHREADSDVDPDIPLEELPRCTKCGALARPDVVWFTEVPQHIDEVMRIVDDADVCIVVGTSAVVHPAATFSAKVKEHGGTVAVFNIEPGKRDAFTEFVFLGPCEDILPRVFDTTQLK